MIRAAPGSFSPENALEQARLEKLRQKVNDENYIYEAVQRIALVLSNELLGIPMGGALNEQRWKRRK